MDKIEKALRKFSPKERKNIKQILQRLVSGNMSGLDIKKLRGRDDIFRIRKGNLRIIYRKAVNEQLFILEIERRKENTYRI